MPTLCFVGDTHGALLKMYAALQDFMERTGVHIDGIVQVGDLGVFSRGTDWSAMWNSRTPAPIPTWAIMGNHEEPQMVAEWQRDSARIAGMTLMPDGGILDVLGVKIGCIWGNYSPVSWLNPARVQANRKYPGNSHSARIAMHIDRTAVERLLETPGPMDVLITHDSATVTLPLGFRGRKMDPLIAELLGLNTEEAALMGGCPGFNEVLTRFKPARYFFGHFHTYEHGFVTHQPEAVTRWTCLNALGYDGGPWSEILTFPGEQR